MNKALRSATRVAIGLGALAAPGLVAAAEPADGQSSEATAKRAQIEALESAPGLTVHTVFSAAAGFGLRFNNPYRLATQLGDDAASLSVTQPYLDFGGSVLAGSPDGVLGGGAVHFGTTVDGPLQPYVTPSVVLGYRADLPVLLYARLGLPILLSPDVNVGGEIAASVSYFFTSGIGLTTEIAFDLFYGAATLDSQYSVIPILFFQTGLVLDYEFLP